MQALECVLPACVTHDCENVLRTSVQWWLCRAFRGVVYDIVCFPQREAFLRLASGLRYDAILGRPSDRNAVS